MDPEQKIRIVRALQAQGQSVAMTGDGVNDAPALRQAEIGVAMGRGGTDVAREAADMVLLDDRFATIVTAVREGRRIYDDIRKFIRYALTGNTGEIWVVFLAPFLGMPVPLLPIHILWVNLITDGLPGLALAEEPAERDVMARPPRPPEESIFARGLGFHVLWVGGLIAALTLATQAWALSEDTRQWQSMVFTVLVFCQLVHSMAIRSESRSLFRMGLFTNPALLGAIALSVVLQLALLYVPWLQGVFRTTALTPAQLAVVFVVPLVVLVAVEVEKLLVRRGVLHYGDVPVTHGAHGTRRPPAAHRSSLTHGRPCTEGCPGANRSAAVRSGGPELTREAPGPAAAGACARHARVPAGLGGDRDGLGPAPGRPGVPDRLRRDRAFQDGAAAPGGPVAPWWRWSRSPWPARCWPGPLRRSGTGRRPPPPPSCGCRWSSARCASDPRSWVGAAWVS